MKTLVFATNNQHKLEEVQALIGDKFLLKTLNEIGCLEEIPETGHTFIENASQKSQFIFNNFKADCFSDDSGLEVDALNGDPGVYSARYSGLRDPETNLQLVLKKMKTMENRNARFKCVISLLINGQEHIFEGSAEGTITHLRSGTAGFGYDGIFQPEGYDMTFADMTSAQKNGISHRAKAVEKLVAFLKLQFPE